MPIPIMHVDALTARPFAGNPAAVCVLPAERDAGRMQLGGQAVTVLRGELPDCDSRWFQSGGFMSVYDTLTTLAITLPPVTPAAAAFVPFVRTGRLIFVSGHIARKDGQPWVGQLGGNITTAEGREAARGIAIELLGALHAATANLDTITRIVKLLVLVNSTPSFTEPHLVANGASELLIELFGDRGAHARSAIGVAQLPLGACVEIELIAEVA